MKAEKVFGTVGLYTVAVGVLSAVVQSGQLFQKYLMINKPHPNKTHLSFDTFYPFYLQEHLDEVNRLLHFTGTSLIFLICLLTSPRTLPCMILGLPLALATFYLTVDMPKGFIEGAVLLASFITFNRIFTGNYRSALVVIFLGYGFAWFGHFIFEKNKPATFTYPTFSLMGDFMMWFQLVTGQIKLKT